MTRALRNSEITQGELEDFESLVQGLTGSLHTSVWAKFRVLQAINGAIQWVTVAASLWCALILFARGHWAGFQRDIVAGTVELTDIGVSSAGWANSIFDRKTLTQLLDRWGRQILALRLFCDMTAEKDSAPADKLIGELSQSYLVEVREREYTLVSWLIGLVPTLGFIGTIYGMMMAMGGAGEVVGAEGQQELKSSIDKLSGHLGTAFDTTLIALVLSILLDRLRGSVRDHETTLFEFLRSESVRPEVFIRSVDTTTKAQG